MRIGIIGIGAIGKELCRAIDAGTVNAELTAIYDRDEAMARNFASELRSWPEVLKLDQMLEAVDLVVEAASQAAVREVAIHALEKGRSVMIMSTGALLDEKLFLEMKKLAEQNNCRVYIPSGAILGIDGLRAASIGGIERVTLTVTKPPIALEDAPFVKEKAMDLRKIKKATTLFDGQARDAVRLFPANVNVAATLSLIAPGAEHRVRIVADPAIKRNMHVIEIKGKFGEASIRVKNLPSPCNPRTSYLAVLSAVATLKRISEPVQIGT